MMVLFFIIIILDYSLETDAVYVVSIDVTTAPELITLAPYKYIRWL